MQGRARAATSKYCILVDSCNAEQFAADLETYKGIESVSLICIAFVTCVSYMCILSLSH